jgi:hypothetical protein
MFIVQYNLVIPIVHIKDKLYLIGSNRMSCALTRDQLMVRVGGGYERFEEYVPNHHRYFMRMLVVHMIKSGESLEWVIEQLIQGKRIKNIHLEAENQARREGKFSRSRSRGSTGRQGSSGYYQKDVSARKSLSGARSSWSKQQPKPRPVKNTMHHQ